MFDNGHDWKSIHCWMRCPECNENSMGLVNYGDIKLCAPPADVLEFECGGCGYKPRGEVWLYRVRSSYDE